MNQPGAEESLSTGRHRIQVVGIVPKHAPGERRTLALVTSAIKQKDPRHVGHTGIRVQFQRLIRILDSSLENSTVASGVLELLMKRVAEPGIRVGETGIDSDRAV